ncbi:MAG: hypothetical protein AMS24_04670 [Chlamydiae bacterium SM23_39]|nr:MAG: hypothetical protein AMS24_04670 [Chlamydiae bacterium SM23_39]
MGGKLEVKPAYITCKHISHGIHECGDFLTKNSKDASKVLDIVFDTFNKLAPLFEIIAWLPEHKILINITYEVSKFAKNFKIIAPLTSLLESFYKAAKVFNVLLFSKEIIKEKLSKNSNYSPVFLPATKENNYALTKKDESKIKTDLIIRKIANLIIVLTFLFFTTTDFLGWLSATKIYIHPFPLFIPIIGGILFSLGSSLGIAKSAFKIKQTANRIKNLNLKIKEKEDQNQNEIAKLKINKFQVSYANHSIDIFKNATYVAIGIIVALGTYFQIMNALVLTFTLFVLSSSAILPIFSKIGINITKKIFEEQIKSEEKK